MDGINAALPDTMNTISSVDDNETIGVVVASNSTQPAKYYLYDFQKRTMEWLADSRPWLDSRQMAEMKPIEFNARDGKKLHGYLTVPKGSDGKNLPLVVNPHGGPWARDGWGLQRRNSVPGEPWLRRATGKFPRLNRFRHGSSAIQLEAVGTVPCKMTSPMRFNGRLIRAWPMANACVFTVEVTAAMPPWPD